MKRSQNKEKSIKNAGSCKYSELFKNFTELNKPFLPSPNSNKFNLKNIFQRNTYHKVKVLPTKFLRFWERCHTSDEMDDNKFLLKFHEFMDEIRPSVITNFTPLVVLDPSRFPVHGIRLNQF